MTEKLQAIVRLIRPVNFLITFITVVVAVIICRPELNLSYTTILAALSASFTLASGNVINDIFDIDIDRINHSSRPLPSGLISAKSAWYFYILLFLISVISALFVSIPVFAVVFISQFILFLYSKYFKKIPLLGNFAVAFLAGFVFIYGGLAVQNPEDAIVPAIFAFLITLIREIVKDMQDVEGDKPAGIVSFPIKYGFRKTKMLCLALIILLILFTFYPFITRLFKIEYFIIVMVVVNPLMVYSIKLMYENQAEKNLSKISNILKSGIIIGLIAIYAGV